VKGSWRVGCREIAGGWAADQRLGGGAAPAPATESQGIGSRERGPRKGTVWTHETGRGRLLAVQRFDAGLRIRRSVLTDDESRLVTVADDGTTIPWDVASGHRLEGFRAPTMAERNMGLSPDGKWIAESAPESATILRDAASGSPRRLEGPSGHSLVFSPCGDSFTIWGWGTWPCAPATTTRFRKSLRIRARISRLVHL
jgi:hypothetical protein